MAEQDNSSRTEQPTDRRLEDSRKRGNVAVSQDVKVWASLVVSALVVVTWLPDAGRDLVRLLTPFLAAPEAMAIGAGEGVLGLGGLLRDVGLVLAPMLAALVVVAAASCLIQVGLLWAPAKIKPEWGKISPLKGLSRMFSAQALFEFGKGIVKILVVGAVAEFGAAGKRLVAGDQSRQHQVVQVGDEQQNQPENAQETGEGRALLVGNRILDDGAGKGGEEGDEGSGRLQRGQGDAGNHPEEDADHHLAEDETGESGDIVRQRRQPRREQRRQQHTEAERQHQTNAGAHVGGRETGQEGEDGADAKKDGERDRRLADCQMHQHRPRPSRRWPWTRRACG